MGKKFIIGFGILTLITINSIEINAEEIVITEEQIIELGIPEEYSENIVTYIDDMDLSNEEIISLINDNMQIVDYLQEENTMSNIELRDILALHNYLDETLEELNLELDIDIFDRNIKIVDSLKKNILFQCGVEEIKTYYEDFIKAGGTEHIKSVFLEMDSEREIEDNNIDNYEDQIEEYINEDKYESDVITESIESKEMSCTKSIDNNREVGNGKNDILKYLGVIAIIIILIALIKP